MSWLGTYTTNTKKYTHQIGKKIASRTVSMLISCTQDRNFTFKLEAYWRALAARLSLSSLLFQHLVPLSWLIKIRYCLPYQINLRQHFFPAWYAFALQKKIVLYLVQYNFCHTNSMSPCHLTPPTWDKSLRLSAKHPFPPPKPPYSPKPVCPISATLSLLSLSVTPSADSPQSSWAYISLVLSVFHELNELSKCKRFVPTIVADLSSSTATCEYAIPEKTDH